MRAAVYSREIAGTDGEPGQYDCTSCAYSPAMFAERGRCVGEPAGPLTLRVETPGAAPGSDYSVRFDVCPRGLLRADLRPREVLTARVVSHAAAAEVDKRWPDLPARLSGLLGIWRHAEADRQRDEMNAIRRKE